MTDCPREPLDALREAVQRLPAAGAADPAPFEPGVARADHLSKPELRWEELDARLPQLSGRRVLVLGGDTEADAAAFAARGAQVTVVDAAAHTRNTTSRNRSANGAGAAVRRFALEALTTSELGHFDILHCFDMLHRVPDPMTLLSTLRRLTADNGTLLVGAMMLSDPERSEYLRFIPDRVAADRTWWFVPGRLALRWMLQNAGFDVQEEFGQREGPRDRVPVVWAYLRASACAPRSA